ncbi:hypothetical protein TRFO_29676 [Tritrichomonas foetus]|uniref:Uncharacterized protein n=1 Tax=Tritrichomonas foetus TaxID=1144522 RepID=A0A1J4JZR2_9EUKA|nr:hypothetical protein TRFO_29676 [Tritrichomonas foetus]|eukprot:OHT03020.1 hypothetical protein TRFO_29676 [Tritrichomonas foetus]
MAYTIDNFDSIDTVYQFDNFDSPIIDFSESASNEGVSSLFDLLGESSQTRDRQISSGFRQQSRSHISNTHCINNADFNSRNLVNDRNFINHRSTSSLSTNSSSSRDRHWHCDHLCLYQPQQCYQGDPHRSTSNSLFESEIDYSSIRHSHKKHLHCAHQNRSRGFCKSTISNLDCAF